MEVHHGHHAPKNWKEYFVEFLMLFTAVTLGFFAENVREHYIESHRESQYMESLLADLKIDQANLKNSIPYQQKRVEAMDSLFLFFKNNVVSSFDSNISAIIGSLIDNAISENLSTPRLSLLVINGNMFILFS